MYSARCCANAIRVNSLMSWGEVRVNVSRLLAKGCNEERDVMRVALTGATGFIGRYIANHLAERRALATLLASSDPATERASTRSAISQWIEGDLGDRDSASALVEGCDAVVHAALYRPGIGFRGAEGDLVEFVEKNVVGTLELIEAARRANVGRFVFISTCAVHEKILDDRPLDEAHPLWATSHYGAHKAAIEKFVHSYGLGQGYPICALRPTGVYGVAHPVQNSKWYDLVSAVVRGETVTLFTRRQGSPRRRRRQSGRHPADGGWNRRRSLQLL